MERLILFTGKGGVGKTSLAAAHALASSEGGKRTLLAGLDAAHNLSDLFEVAPAPEPTQVLPNLEICEIDPHRVREDDYAHLVAALTNAIISDAPDDDRVLDLPGLDSLFFLLKLHDLIESGRYDRVIADLAPTGETMALLQFPDLMAWWMERIFPLERVAVRVLAPVSKRFWGVQMPDRQAMNDVEALYGRLNRIATLLRDTTTSSVRLVAQPERMIVAETKRNAMQLNLFGYRVDHLFINGVFPAEAGEFFAGWIEAQSRHLAELELAFPQVPTTRIPRFPTDLRGVDGITTLAAAALDEHAFDVRDDLAHEQYRTTAAGYDLVLPLPGASKEAIEVSVTDDDLVLRLPRAQRNIPLPGTLHGWDVTRAHYAADTLTVSFARPQGEEK